LFIYLFLAIHGKAQEAYMSGHTAYIPNVSLRS